ncbi:MAG TPA: hypothetical protein VML19_25490, partial [Verrucomicrobiae bacterium]|nr:hypothetical protein [Verrucomicrobiae bacterium]
ISSRPDVANSEMSVAKLQRWLRINPATTKPQRLRPNQKESDSVVDPEYLICSAGGIPFHSPI